MTPEPVYVAPYDPRWPSLFEEERAFIEEAIGPWGEAVEHVGSTAVPGLDAKPIVDIAVGIRVPEHTDFCIRLLEGVGYRYRGAAGVPDRTFFYKKQPRAYNLHRTVMGSEFWRSHLLFRDYLRSHPKAARDYARLKHELARRFRYDREAYTAAKEDFVAAVVAQARKP